MDDVQLILEEFSGYLSITNIFVYFWRKLAWAVLREVKKLLDGIEGVLDGVYKMVNFLKSESIQKFVTDNRVAIFSVGVICLLIFCILYMQNSKKTSMKTLINNLLLGTGVIMLSVTLTATLTTGAFSVAKAIYKGETSTADQIFNANIYDVTSFDSFNWESKDKVVPIDYDEESLKLMDITAEVVEKNLDVENKVTKEVFRQKIYVNPDSSRKLVDLDRGLFKMDERYYRYSWHPWIILFQFIITAIVLLGTSFKYLKCIYNAAFNGMIAPFFSFSDLTEASKVQKIIGGIVNTAINIILFAISLKLYRMMSAYAGTLSLGVIQNLIVQLFLAMAVIEGPWIIQELTGQDGGVRSEMKVAAGAVGAAVYARSRKKQSGNDSGQSKFNSAKDKMKKAGSFLGGLGAGARDFMSKDPLEDEMNLMKESETQQPSTSANPMDGMTEKEKDKFEDEVKSDLSDTAGITDEGVSDMSNSDISADDKKMKVPAPPKGLEAFSAVSPLLEQEMEEQEALAAMTPENTAMNLPAGSMAQSNPLNQEITEAMKETSGSIGNGPRMNSSQLSASDSNNSSPTAAVSAQSLPEHIQSLSGMHEAKQGGFLAPLNNPSSARLANMMRPTTSGGISLQSGQSLSSGAAPAPIAARVPEHINTLPGVQQYHADLAASGTPITTDTFSERIDNRIADRQIQKAEKRKVYQEYHQVGRNTSKKVLDNFTPRKSRRD